MKMPKSQTLEFYKIIKDGEVYKTDGWIKIGVCFQQ